MVVPTELVAISISLHVSLRVRPLSRRIIPPHERTLAASPPTPVPTDEHLVKQDRCACIMGMMSSSTHTMLHNVLYKKRSRTDTPRTHQPPPHSLNPLRPPPHSRDIPPMAPERLTVPHMTASRSVVVAFLAHRCTSLPSVFFSAFLSSPPSPSKQHRSLCRSYSNY